MAGPRPLLTVVVCTSLLYCGRSESGPNGLPAAPSNVVASPGNAKANVRWTPPADKDKAAIIGSTVTSAPGSVTITVPGNETTATVTPLVNGTAYVFTVHATNAAGSSAESEPSGAVTPHTVPGAPAITGVTPGNGQITVSWDPPASDGGSAITGYTVVYDPGSVQVAAGTATSATVTGLVNGTAYTFRVFASNAAGDGPFSAPSAAETPRTVPGAPTGVAATPGNAEATVTWLAPASNGGSAITGYTVTSSPGNHTATTTGTSAVVGGLANGTAYTFTVVATNIAGSSAPSSPSAAVIPFTVPGAPTSVSASADDGRALVSWTAPAFDGGSRITGYVITANPGGATMPVGVTSATFTGLTNGTSYTFTVFAVNAAGRGPTSAPSNAVTPRGVPGPPTNVAGVPGDSSVAVSWNAPASNGGNEIASYTVTASPGGATVSVAAPAASATVTGLANGTPYTFTVFATNSAGNGPPSAPSASVTPARPPNAPTSVAAVGGDAQATVSWTAPAFNGGAPILTYTVTASPASGTTSTGGTSTSVPFAGLTNGTSYSFTVFATNIAGDGPPSSPSLPVTPVAGPAFPVRVSADGRYLLDSLNRPFRIRGDSAYSLIANLTLAEADTYLSDRQAKGFNALVVNLLEHKFAVQAPKNRNGDAPFTTAGDFSTPNEAYFAFADSIIDLAASKGMLVFLEYMYLGSGANEGWISELTSATNTETVCLNFGTYLGTRYKNRNNIVWMSGGDYFPPSGSTEEARQHKILEGIQAAGALQLNSAHWMPLTISTDQPAFAASMNLNAVYTYGPGNNGIVYPEAGNAFSHSSPLPSYLLETGFELEGWIPGDRDSVRKYEYWAALSGATAGVFYGHRDIWEFNSSTWWSGYPFGHQPWQTALNAPAGADVMWMGQLLDSLSWYKLVPSGLAGMRTLVVSGGGGSSDFVAAAAASDGSVILAYLPPTGTSPRTIGIDMAAMAGSARSRWFDPTNGMYTADAASIPNTGTHSFTTPGTNSSGAADWVLVLDRP